MLSRRQVRGSCIDPKMGKLEDSLRTLHEVFTKYASQQGNSDTLNQEELKNVLEAEISGFDEPTLNQLSSEVIKMDPSQDIDFFEFVTIALCLVSSQRPRK
ncbi:protein S100-A1-like [Cetorhinus maximus]